MSSAASILVLGRDSKLLVTRASVLSRAGFEVTALSEWDNFPAGDAVDLLVLCHSLSETDRLAILQSAIVRWPETQRLCMTPASGTVQGLTEDFNSFDGPAKLVQVVRKMLPGTQPIRT